MEASPAGEIYEVQLMRCMSVALEAAQAAGSMVKERFYSDRDKAINHKSAVDLVTEVDVAAEQLIISTLRAAFPDHQFLGEESGLGDNSLTDSPTWIIDPIDGTTNFVHRYPFVGICIALAINKKVVLGVVYNPILEEKYTAIRGEGAFLNDKPIRVSGATEISHAAITTNIGYGRSPQAIEFMLANLNNILQQKARAVRMSGSAAALMCDVACGRMDCYFEWGVHAWDIAAASIIVEEAGGVCVSPTATSRADDALDLTARSMLCAPPELLPKIFAVLTKNWSPEWK